MYGVREAISRTGKLARLLAVGFVTIALSGCVIPARFPYLPSILSGGEPASPKKSGAAAANPKGPPERILRSSDIPLRITLSEAILVGLSNNKEFQVERLQPAVTATSEQEAASVFDPLALAEIERTRQRSDQLTVQQEFKASGRVSRFLPTGTTVAAESGALWNTTIPPGTDPNSDWKTYSQVSVTQALLRGAGVPVNLANLRIARLETQISVSQLSGFAQTLAAAIEDGYWDYFLALGQIDIYSRSLSLAQRIVRETQQRINAGQKARSEIYFVKAEASTREQSLIDAKSDMEKTKIKLLRLMSPPSADLWNQQIRLLTQPLIPGDEIEDLPVHVQLAMRMRPDVTEARLKEQQGQLQVVKTSNGLLPKLDLFIMLGRSGYASSFANSLSDITSGSGGLDFITRGQLEIPIGNQQAIAQYNRSTLTLSQQREAIDNLLQLAQQDVLLAYVELHRAKDQMRVSTNTVRLQLEKRDAEMEKYRLGTSSAYSVAQAERDAVNSEVSALQARIAYLKGLTQFYVAEGTLLARRGIRFP
jgi:outer membrane protein